MDRRVLVVLAALTAPACTAGAEATDTGDLPTVTARLLALVPGTIALAGFDIRTLPHPPPVPAETFDEDALGWAFWAARAASLRLDPMRDASFVAVGADVGSCGITDAFVLAVPSHDAGDLAVHVDDAIRTWRRERAAAADDADVDAPTDPALSSWVPVADGACTVVQATEFDQVGVTLRTDGSLLLHEAPFGDACGPRVEVGEPDPSP